ncbi:MAG: 50S ribosomal protein L13 [Candidatus Saganbacteria bacterium]|nr:50S ribosomal protein L13 [Candidatus Saganbacteria bacterium]
MKKNKTTYEKKETVKRDWYQVDASGKILGRLSTKVAAYLRGKHKPSFTPHVDCGDNVIVVNAAKIRFTGNKAKEKIYFSHSGYPGGARYTTLEEMMNKDPARVIEHSISGMLPKGRLGRKMLKKLKVYADDKHPHRAQKIQELKV